MSEALRTALEPHHRVLKQAAQGSIQGFIASAPPPLPSSTLSAKQQNRQRRYSLYEEMKLWPTAERANPISLDNSTSVCAPCSDGHVLASS
jgi:hypothetical protein